MGSASPLEINIARGLGRLYPYRDDHTTRCHADFSSLVCTLEVDHPGPHIAHGSILPGEIVKLVIAVWGDSLTEEELDLMFVKARLLA